MVIDCITFNGEYDLFELRYQILKDFVDEFRVVEFDTTFSGKDKPNYMKESKNVFYDSIDTWPKVKYYPIEKEQWSKYIEMAKESPNTQYGKGAEHWITEFAQKESIKDCLADLQDDDIVFIGDCDEIWNPGKTATQPTKLKLGVYTYWLNNKSSEEFWGTLVCKYAYIKDTCLNHLRSTNHFKTKNINGWHFTSMANFLKQKLEDSYTEETYATPTVMSNLEENIKQNKDFLGRDFTYRVDENEWPTYLKENRDKYKHLLKLSTGGK